MLNSQPSINLGWFSTPKQNLKKWVKSVNLAPRCRACGHQNLQSILNLGNVPLSNAFLNSPNDPEERYPLELAFCPHCALVQITETIAPEKLFGEYLYFSSVSQTMLEHARDMANTLIVERKLDSNSFVLELASNDGYLLQYFKQAGIPVFGIDPAQNIARIANEREIPTMCAFFDEDLARTLPKADVVIANNVLGHVPDLNGFVSGIKHVLKPDGVAVIEVPYVREMIERCEVDTIYHEHASYFSLTALQSLFSHNGLTLRHAEQMDIHGGSLRLYVTHLYAFPIDQATRHMLEAEKELGIDRMDYYRAFAGQVERVKNQLWGLLAKLRLEDKRIVGYGAAAKGTMLLNLLGLTTGTIDYVIDATPAKQGKFMPGSRVPIVAPEQLGNPDYILILAWNWAHEIIGKHKDFKGKWIIPLPTPLVVGE